MKSSLGISKSELSKEYLARRNARKSLLNFTTYTMPKYRVNWHHKVLCETLDRFIAGDIKRLMVNMPPRFGKSELVSRRLPAYILGKNPDAEVIACAYSADLSSLMNRDVQAIIDSPQYACLFPDTKLSVSNIRTTAHGSYLRNNDIFEIVGHTGGYRSAGVGGAITGMGAHLGIIDDPVKNQEEANSPTIREKVWNWYTTTFYTRLEEASSGILLTMCMTGDTPVLMADGTERPLRGIKVGDVVATYDGGKLGTSIVQGHRNNGPDSLYRIRTISGKNVRANERHPFLVEDGGILRWTRLRDLNTTSKIVTVKGNGASGKARPAWPKDVRNQLSAEGIAPHIITKRCGQTGIAPRRSTPCPAGPPGSNTDMESPPASSTQWSRHKMANAPFADSPLATTCERTGAGSYASTIATKPEGSGGSCATTATSPSHTPRPKRTSSQWPITSDFTSEEITSIEPAGTEDVFDLQIERTENFIANGLVSHNTRWHEDDLAGRLLRKMESGEGEKWEVLKFPAIAEPGNPLDPRAVGESLWPEKFPISRLEIMKPTVGAYPWASLYQQAPAPAGGGLFKREWFQYFDVDGADYILHSPRGDLRVPSYNCTVFQTCDPAGSTKTSADYFALGTWAVTPMQDTLLLDVVHRRLEGPDQPALFRESFQQWNPSVQGVEARNAGLTLFQQLKRDGLPVVELKPDSDKFTRALPMAARYESGCVYHLAGAPWLVDYELELVGFPGAAHDDQVDMAAYAYVLQQQFCFNGVAIESPVIDDRSSVPSFGSDWSDSIPGF